ncbi:MAG: DUF2341 domain-containing protein, partial [Actinobacteria bacterium]
MRVRRLTALTICFCLLFQIISTIPVNFSFLGSLKGALMNITYAKPKPTKVELTDKRTANSKTYLNPDGTYTTEITQEVNKNNLTVDFSDNQSNLFSLAKKDNKNLGLTYKLLGEKKRAFKPIKKAKNKVVYSNITTDTDLEYLTEQGRLKEQIILKKKPRSNVFTFELNLRNLIPSPQKDGSINLTDKNKKTSIVIEKPFMTDSAQAEAYSPNVTMALRRRAGSTYILRVVADRKWLADPKRVYPVKIDPTFITQERPDADTYVSSAQPDSSFASDTRLRVGAKSESEQYKTLIRYPLNSIPGNANITEAKLQNIMPDYGTNNSETNINAGSPYYKGQAKSRVYKMTENWDSTATWNSKSNKYDANSKIDASDNTVDNQAFNVTDIVKGWQASPTQNYGFMLDNTSKVYLIDDALPTNPSWSWVGSPLHSGTKSTSVNGRVYNSWKNTSNDYYIPTDSPIEAWCFVQSAPQHLGISLQNGDAWHTGYWGAIATYGSHEEDIYFPNKVNIGGLPPGGSWQKLSFIPSQITLGNSMINGLHFAALPSGQVYFDDVYTYRKMVFHSSESEDGSKAPRLVITYEANDYGRKSYRTYKEYSGVNVDLKNGNLMLEASDVSIKTQGPSMRVARTYNSHDKTTRIFGRGVSSYPDCLRVDYNGSSTAILTDETGAIFEYTKEPNGSFKRPKGTTDDLVLNENNTFVLKRKDLSIVEFDSFGRAAKELDKNGNSISFTYNDNGHIEKIVDDNNPSRFIKFNYKSALEHKVVSVVDFTGRTYSYEYNDTFSGDNLSKVTYPLPRNSTEVAYSYSYDVDGLKTITNPLGGQTKVSYLSGGVSTVTSLVTTQLPNGNSINIEYVTENVNDNPWTTNEREVSYTKVADPKGYEYLYYFNPEGLKTVAGEPEGSTVITEAQKPFFPGASVEQEIAHEYLVYYTVYKDFYEEELGLDEEDLDWLDESYDDFDEDADDLEAEVVARKEIQWEKKQLWNDIWGPAFAKENIPSAELSQPFKHGSECYFEYDNDYNLVKQINKDKTFTSYEYDANGNVLKEINHDHDANEDEQIYLADQARYSARHRVTERSYNQQNLVLAETTPTGKTTNYTYDDKGNLLSETDPDNNTTSYAYDDNGNQVTQTTPEGGVANNRYDALGNIIETIDPVGVSTAFEYDSLGRKTKEQKAGMDFSLTEYDELGRVIRKKEPANDNGDYSVTENTYDAAGNVIFVQAFNNNTDGSSTTKGYNTYSYNVAGQLLEKNNKKGARYSYQYDENGNKTKEINNFRNGETTYEYDKLNRLIKETASDGNWTAYAYDSFGNVTKQGSPEGTSVSLYDKAGNEVATGDQTGNVTKTTYDKEGNERTTADGKNNVVSYNYNQNDNLSTVKDGSLNKTNYEYDNNQNETKVIAPDNTSTAAAYNASDQVTTETDQNVKTVETNYNNSGLTENIIQPNEKNQSLNYDSAGNLTKLNAEGNIQSSVDVENSYDWMGNLVETVTKNPASGQSQTSYEYRYNNDDMIGSVKDASNKVINFQYDPDDKIKNINDSTVETRYEYNSSSKLDYISNNSGKTLSDFSYDKGGKSNNIDQITSPLNALSSLITNYDYDAASKLTSISNARDNGAQGVDELSTYRYYYDKNGNIIKSVAKESSGLYDLFADDFSVFNPVLWNSKNANAYHDPANGQLVLQGDNNTPTNPDTWYDSAWLRRAPLMINNLYNPEDLTDYQVKISIDYDTGMKADFSDLRFTDSNKQTELPYWIEDKTDSKQATVWVKVALIKATSIKTIYMYYGNPEANSQSNGNGFSGSDLGLIPVISGNPTTTKQWYGQAWPNRASLKVDNKDSSSTLTDYQIKVKVPYVSKMQNNFSDLRFTDSDGVAELNYWIESYKRSEEAIVWIKVPEIKANSNKTIYMYYGNPNAGSASDGSKVFDAYNVGGLAAFYNMDEDAFKSNLLTNASFESGLTNWGHYGNLNHAVYSNQASSQHGNNYLETNIITPNNGDSWFQDVNVSASANDNYTFSIYIKSPGGQNISGTLALFDMTGGNYAAGNYFSTNSKEWQRYSVTLPIRNFASLTRALRAQVYMHTPGVNYDFDAAQLEQGSKATEFIEGAASGNVADQTGQNSGTSSSGTATTSDAKFGRAAYFDGLNDSITASDSQSLRISNYSVDFWLKPYGQPNEDFKGLVGKPGRNFNAWLNFTGYIHHCFHTANNVNEFINTPAGNISWDNWNHITLTNNGQTAKTYINGIEKASAPTTPQIVDNTDLMIGRELDSGAARYFKGAMDELKIYNRALSADEVSSVSKNQTQKMGDVFNVCKSAQNEPEVSLNLDWFNEDWLKRSEITLDNTENSNTLNDYPVKLEVDYQPGMKSDFSDLCFTDSDNLTKLAYWIENYTESSRATIWVRVPEIKAALLKTVNMYYCNPLAKSASDGVATFDGFDMQNISAFYKFDEASWNGTPGEVADQIGINNANSFGSASTVPDAKFGRAAYFDGYDDYLETQSPQNVDLSYGSFTVEAWSKRQASDVDNEHGTIMATGGSGWAQGFILQHRNGGFWAEVSDGVGDGKYIQAPGQGISDGAWHHFVLVVNREQNTAYGYLDGKLIAGPIDVSSETGSLHGQGSPVRIGRLGVNSTTDQYFRGCLDEVKIYNQPLTAEQITSRYQNQMEKIADHITIRKLSSVEPTVSVSKPTTIRDWYSDSWTKRAPLRIDNTTNPKTLNNYQVKVVLEYKEAMKSDFSDLRFTDTDKISEIPYWIESKTDGTKATVWLKVPSLLAKSAKTIYMYYGNANAVSASDGNRVFEEYDIKGMQGFWTLDSQTGNTVKDETGVHNGTIVGGLTNSTDAKFNKSANFDGSDDCIELGNWFGYQTFSISMWVNPGNSQVAYANIIDNNHRYGTNWVMQQDNNDINRFYWGISDHSDMHPTNAIGTLINPNQWSHLVITRDGNSKENKVYLNGILVGAKTGTSMINYDGNQFLRLGNHGAGGRNFKGKLDEVQILNRSLSADEVSTLSKNYMQKMSSTYNIRKYCSVEPKAAVIDTGDAATTQQIYSEMHGTQSFNRELCPSIKVDFMTDNTNSKANIATEGYDGKDYRNFGLVVDSGNIMAKTADD